MADYTKNIATATRLISQKGQNMLYNSVERVFNPDTREEEEVITSIPFMGVKTNPKTDEIEAGYPSNSIIVLASGSSLSAVSLKDTIGIGEKTYNIEKVEEVAPAEQVILYKLILLEK